MKTDRIVWKQLFSCHFYIFSGNRNKFKIAGIENRVGSWDMWLFGNKLIY